MAFCRTRDRSTFDMRPSTVLNQRRADIRAAARRYRSRNVRVFGSTRYGTDRDGSDLDLLVDVQPGTTLLDLGGLQAELEDMLGIPVDLLTPGDLPASFRKRVLADAMPI